MNPTTRDAFMPVYAPPDILFTRGEGCYLFTDTNDKYLDFTTGIAVNCLGHSHPHIVKALKDQSDKLWHLSNMFRIESAETLASRLAALTFADVMFFANSGAEANECGLKAMRRYHYDKGDKQRTRIIGMTHSFHGRTIATVCASGNKSYMAGFIPNDYGFDQVEFGDIDALKATITDETAGIILEPIQGEGGINVADKAYLQAVRDLCDAEGILLMFDEVQCGAGRTGYLYAYEALGVTPDVLTSAKGIGGGFPVGVCMATNAVGQHMVVGTHGSTFGGNPLATAVSNAVLDIISDPAFLTQVRDNGEYLRAALTQLANKYPHVYGQVTGLGLMVGLKVTPPNTELLTMLRNEHHILVVKAGGNSLRLLPPLIVSKAEIDQLINALDQVAQTYQPS
ncbi:aspartate aminotransferase family protein [Ostreibacterium oceani]|uniref:Acetylornithine aminotransferase n=1 Tax=Ostreibacterium oceani TaxID=2654998 RepID=A0A6N7EW88_9GAMM|nr:aspartate aminotransferase family protein [Ostreibacterium oceani]MPV86772.1 acetylornithine/succinylornithine family transaminase [Ostreibacterium oceani]